MDLNQASDWRQVYHLTVLLAQHVSNVHRLEYFWSHMFDIEKAIPTTVSLSEPGLDGVYRIPLTLAQSRARNWLVIRVVYATKEDDYSLVTAKHLSETHINPKGHEVKKVSILARAPFAWVKVHVHTDVFPFCGDVVDGYQPESIVSRIYSTMDRQFRTVLFRVANADVDMELHIAELVSDTLSRLAALLAFKAVYEQSRLTLERLRCGNRQDIDFISKPEDRLWGTSVLWTLSSDLTRLTRETVNQHTLWPRRKDGQFRTGWLQVELTHTGLSITKCVSESTCTQEALSTPYWAVILTALCCGALDRWCSVTQRLLESLKVDTERRSGYRFSDLDVCQRCGYAYRNPPTVCPKDPERVSAVAQIDKLLYGNLCTSLCARVSDSCENGKAHPERPRTLP